MLLLEDLNDFISKVDSIQARFHQTVVAQQREDSSKRAEYKHTPESIVESDRYIDSQWETF
jgi:hypothetical protein